MLWISLKKGPAAEERSAVPASTPMAIASFHNELVTFTGAIDFGKWRFMAAARSSCRLGRGQRH